MSVPAITYTVTMPGAFDAWFSGSSAAQGETGDDVGMVNLHAAYRAAQRRKVGRRGYTLTLTLNADGLECLREYALTCAEISRDERRYDADCAKDYRAAVSMIDRLNVAQQAVAA